MDRFISAHAWLVAHRRVGAAMIGLAVGAGMTIGSWTQIGMLAPSLTAGAWYGVVTMPIAYWAIGNEAGATQDGEPTVDRSPPGLWIWEVLAAGLAVALVALGWAGVLSPLAFGVLTVLMLVAGLFAGFWPGQRAR